MDRKMSTSTEQLCKGYATEFRSYFEYCRSLRFEDRPDYAYLKRLFKELFYRKGFQYDNMFDWTVLNLQQERAKLPPERPLLGGGGKAAGGGGGGDGVEGGERKQPLENERERSRSANDGMANNNNNNNTSQRSGSRGRHQQQQQQAVATVAHQEGGNFAVAAEDDLKVGQ